LAATAKKSSGSFTFIFLILLFAVGYMFLIRPQRQRRQRQLQSSKQISVGDKVMLTSGIIGRVVGFEGDHARIEVAPGMVIEVVRQAVSQRIDESADGGHDHGTDASYGVHGHDDLVDDTGHDPYSVAPLEPKETDEPRGNGSGGGSR
jgi:preprotein translocase subunit YajC